MKSCLFGSLVGALIAGAVVSMPAAAAWIDEGRIDQLSQPLNMQSCSYRLKIGGFAAAAWFIQPGSIFEYSSAFDSTAIEGHRVSFPIQPSDLYQLWSGGVVRNEETLRQQQRGDQMQSLELLLLTGRAATYAGVAYSTPSLVLSYVNVANVGIVPPPMRQYTIPAGVENVVLQKNCDSTGGVTGRTTPGRTIAR